MTGSATIRTAAGVDADAFKTAFRFHPSGIAVITADPGSGPVALTATSLFSASARPPVVGFSVAETASTASALAEAEVVTIHLIGPESLEIAKRAAASGSDRFSGTRWMRGRGGVPYFVDVLPRLTGHVISRAQAGEATVHLVQLVDITLGPQRDGPALVYWNRGWFEIDKSDAISEDSQRVANPAVPQ